MIASMLFCREAIHSAAFLFSFGNSANYSIPVSSVDFGLRV